jgi:hypothetical protein
MTAKASIIFWFACLQNLFVGNLLAKVKALSEYLADSKNVQANVASYQTKRKSKISYQLSFCILYQVIVLNLVLLFLKNKFGLFALGVILAFLFLTICVSLVAIYDKQDQKTTQMGKIIFSCFAKAFKKPLFVLTILMCFLFGEILLNINLFVFLLFFPAIFIIVSKKCYTHLFSE